MDRSLLTISLIAVVVAVSGCADSVPIENYTNSIEDSPHTRFVYNLENVSNPERVTDVVRTRLHNFDINANARKIAENGTQKLYINTDEANQTRIRELMKPGNFEAEFRYITDGGNLTINQENKIEIGEESITISNKEIRIGEEKEVDGTSIKLQNIQNGQANLSVEAYNSKDIQDVPDQEKSIQGTGSTYTYRFPIIISKEAADRVRKIANNYPTTMNERSNSEYLAKTNGEKAKLHFKKDGETLSSLTISATFQERIITRPRITGTEPTRNEAKQAIKKHKAMLKSGKLPENLTLQQIKNIK